MKVYMNNKTGEIGLLIYIDSIRGSFGIDYAHERCVYVVNIKNQKTTVKDKLKKEFTFIGSLGMTELRKFKK